MIDRSIADATQSLAGPATPPPAKPQVGAPCNGCGLCCRLAVCEVGTATMGLGQRPGDRAPGPCPALVIQSNGRTACDLVLRPQDYAPGKGSEKELRAAAAVLIHSGIGCDTVGDGVSELGDDERPDAFEVVAEMKERAMTRSNLASYQRAFRTWFGPVGDGAVERTRNLTPMSDLRTQRGGCGSQVPTTPIMAKPPVGAACNSCGLCCQLKVCGVGAITLGLAASPDEFVPGPCPALRVQPDGRQECGLVLRPKDFSHGKGGAHDLRAAARTLIGAGTGCDFIGEGDDPSAVDALVERLAGSVEPAKVVEAATRWFAGPEGAARWFGSLSAAQPSPLDQPTTVSRPRAPFPAGTQSGVSNIEPFHMAEAAKLVGGLVTVTDEAGSFIGRVQAADRYGVHLLDEEDEGYTILPVELAQRIVTIVPIEEAAPSPVEPGEKDSTQSLTVEPNLPVAPRPRMLMSRPETMLQLGV